jgi:double-strand break repair protein MRE11
VIWGHEHDCFTSLIASVEPETMVYQPGSSVATSFTDGEALPKHVGLMEVMADGSFRVEYVRLQTVREMVVEDRDYVYFREEDLRNEPRTETEIKRAIRDYVLLKIKEANESRLS